MPWMAAAKYEPSSLKQTHWNGLQRGLSFFRMVSLRCILPFPTTLIYCWITMKAPAMYATSPLTGFTLMLYCELIALSIAIEPPWHPDYDMPIIRSISSCGIGFRCFTLSPASVSF